MPPSETSLKDDAPAVRFSSAVEEIDPQTPTTSGDAIVSPGHAGEVAADQLKAFTKSLHGRPLQERRMNTFQFEAFSLPPSRVSKLMPKHLMDHDEFGASGMTQI